MPVLLLAQGDLSAKNMLKSAIKARYGTRPPILESARIDFRGRANVKFGQSRGFVPVDATVLFRFPNAMRLDLVIRPPGTVAHRLIESTDGYRFYFTPDNKAPHIVTDSQHQHSMLRRMWAMASLLLVPLSEINVRLTETSFNSFKATHLRYSDSAHIKLNGFSTMEQVQVHCLNPRTLRQQAYTLMLSPQLRSVDGINMPEKMRIYWGRTPFMELSPYAIERDISIPDSIFRVAVEGNAIHTARA